MEGNCEWLAEQFETHRIHLRAVAYRMLGSHGDANDAVQETWLRVSRAGTSGVENLGGWLTTILSRVCLDMLRSQKSRREKPLDAGQPGPAANGENVANPEREIVLAVSVGLALHMGALKRCRPASASRSCCTICSTSPSMKSHPWLA